jgi:HAD superfamily hydrolase (TIGR01509 family)
MPIRTAAQNAYALRGRMCDETIADLVTLRAHRKFGALFETGVSLADGARTFIELLHGRTRLGIVSRAARAEIDTTLRLAALDHAFEFIISDDDAYAPKPSPAPYIGALDRLARRRVVKPAHVVALEDGSAGIRSAKGAGVRCAVVGAVPIHRAVDADALVPSLAGQTAASLDALTLGARTADR